MTKAVFNGTPVIIAGLRFLWQNSIQVKEINSAALKEQEQDLMGGRLRFLWPHLERQTSHLQAIYSNEEFSLIFLQMLIKRIYFIL